MRSEEKKRKITIFILLSACLLSSLGVAGVSMVRGQRLYCGYAYYDPPGGSAPYGVKGTIKTIDKTVPEGYYFYCQSVTIIISYANGYWVQVGYYKGEVTDRTLKFYVERYDGTSYYNRTWKGTPSSGNSYTYYIEPDSGSKDWKLAAISQFTNYTNTNPDTSVDLQALVETTTDDINIDGTDYTYLSYKVQNDWRLWSTHEPSDDPPYSLTEESDYEFEASGGG